MKTHKGATYSTAAYGLNLTKREYFAIKCLQGVMANDFTGTRERFAEVAIAQADELLKQLEV